MSDPLRTDAARTADGLTDADKEARIEQLLLAGLDHYFAGRYEQAINIWTRVIFLERGHGRARAYIERARGALAERQRESDELLQRGIAAFDEGENDEARSLITRAVEEGGTQDEALVVLERLNRLASPAVAETTDAPPARVDRRRGPRAAAAAVVSRSWLTWAVAALGLLIAGAVAAVLGGAPLPRWLADPAGSPQTQVAAMPLDPLPIARPSERTVARARELRTAGQLHEAIRLLESVAIGDPMRGEADRLRGELQRQILGAAR